MSNDNDKPKKDAVVGFRHAFLDDILGAEGSDRRKARIMMVNAAFARRGMNLRVERVAKGQGGVSIATLYVLSEVLDHPMERFMFDNIVEVERRAREEAKDSTGQSYTRNGAECSGAEDACCVIENDPYDGQDKCMSCGLLKQPEA